MTHHVNVMSVSRFKNQDGGRKDTRHKHPRAKHTKKHDGINTTQRPKRTRASVGASTTTRRAAAMTAAAELGVLLGTRVDVLTGVCKGTLWRAPLRGVSADAGTAVAFLGGGVLCTSVNLTMPTRGSGTTLVPSFEADDDVGAVNEDTPWLRKSRPRDNLVVDECALVARDALAEG
jgi:hypothetical protein